MAIPPIPDPYRALGLTPEATAAEIRSAYKKLMLKCHPDKVHDESQKEEKAQQYEKVMTAYELLSDPKKKRKYDLQRQTGSENRPTNGTATTDTTTKAEARDTSEEGRKEKSRERPRHESTRQARREYESEEYVKTRDVPKRDVPKEEEMRREKEASRERDAPKEREAPLDRGMPKERDVHRETPIRESDATQEVPREIPRETESREKESSRDRNRSHKESSRDRDRSHKDHKEPREYYKEPREHKHSRESSKEKDRKHNVKSETSPPPAPEPYTSHQQKYQEEKRLEEEKLKKARESMGIFAERSDSARRREGEERERERYERENIRFAQEEAQKLKRARERIHVYNAEEHDGFNMDDIYPKPTESRRGSTQKREPSPKDSPPSSRERKSSHSPSHRGGSHSPVRGEQLHSSSGRPIPLRTPYGSAPPPAAGSTFATFSSSVSPRRRHSVSTGSQDPMKATRLHPQDSGYSSPNPGTPMGPERIPTLMRSSTESGERSAGWFGVYDDPEAATGYTSMPMPGHMHRRKTTSHHPLDSNLTSSPIHPSEFRKPAPVPSASSASNAYYYPSPTYYASPTHAPHHYSSGSSSVHPQQSPTRSHSTRHSSSHNHSVSPHGSPKVAQEAFLSMNDVRSPTMSGASTVHHTHTPGYHSSHYGRTEYFSPPVLPTRHTI